MRRVAAISAGPRSASPRGSRAFTGGFGGGAGMGLAGPARLKGTGPCHKRREGPGQGGALVVETSFPICAAVEAAKDCHPFLIRYERDRHPAFEPENAKPRAKVAAQASALRRKGE